MSLSRQSSNLSQMGGRSRKESTIESADNVPTSVVPPMRANKFAGLAAAPAVALDVQELVPDVAEVLPDESSLLFFHRSREPIDGAIVLTEHHLVLCRVFPAPTATEVVFPISEIGTVCESSLDQDVLYIAGPEGAGPMSHREYERRLLFFSSKRSKESLLAHLFMKKKSESQQLKIVTWKTNLNAVSDVRRNLGSDRRRQALNQSEISVVPGGMESTEHDSLRIGDNVSAVAKMMELFNADEKKRKSKSLFLSKSFRFLMGNNSDDEEEKEDIRKDKKVLFSCEASLASNKHDIIVITDQALYVTKMRNPALVRFRVPLPAIEAVVLDSSNPMQCLIQLDFNIVTLKSDLTVLCQPRVRDNLVKALANAFEALLVQRLKISSEETIFWARRGLAESQLLRLVGVLKAKHDKDLTQDSLGMQEKQECQWLVFLATHRSEVLVNIMSTLELEQEELQFIARCLLSLCRSCGAIEELIKSCVTQEVSKHEQKVNAGVGSDFTLFNDSSTLVSAIVGEFVGSTGEQYLRVVLSQVFEEFSELDFRDGPMAETQQEWWSDQFLRAIMSASNSEILPDEVKIVVALIAVVCRSKNFDPYPLIGTFVFSRYFTAAITDPLSHGLWPSREPSEGHLASLQRIGGFLLQLASCDGSVGTESKRASVLDYLKDMVFEDVLYESDKPQFSTNLEVVSQMVKHLDLSRYHLLLLLAIVKAMGQRAAHLIAAAWFFGREKGTGAVPQVVQQAAASEVPLVDGSHADSKDAPEMDSEDERETNQEELRQLQEEVARLRNELATTRRVAARASEDHVAMKLKLQQAMRDNAQLQLRLERHGVESSNDSEDDFSDGPSSPSKPPFSPLSKRSAPSVVPQQPRKEQAVRFGCPLDTYVLPAGHQTENFK